jgi:hypothetical protein
LLSPGGLFTSTNVEHWGEAPDKESVLDLDIFTPPREEYGRGPKG